MQAKAPVIVAAREIIPSPSEFLPNVRFETAPPSRWTVEQKQTYIVRAANLGGRTWRTTPPGQIILHAMFIGPGDSTTVDSRVELRQPITHEVRPGDTLEMEVTLTAPRKEGAYRLRQQLELDGRGDRLGSPPVDTAVTVEERRRR
jgi:hypothetical protein